MDHCLLEIVSCPVCHSKLHYNKTRQELICKSDALAYPLRNRIPVLIESEARVMTLEEINL